MKRGMVLTIIMATLVLFTGCQKDNNNGVGNEPAGNNIQNNVDNNGTSQDGEAVIPNQLPESKLFETVKKIYEVKNPDLALGNIPVDLADNEAVKTYTGLSDSSKVKDIAVSEAMIGAQAYSLVLVQLNNTGDTEAVANEMLNGIDQRKWICVEADDLQVVAQDDLIMLFMVSSELKDVTTSQDMVDAFKKVRGDKLDIQLKK